MVSLCGSVWPLKNPPTVKALRQSVSSRLRKERNSDSKDSEVSWRKSIAYQKYLFLEVNWSNLNQTLAVPRHHLRIGRLRG